MIRVILEIRLAPPYRFAFTTLLDFINLWNCVILAGGTAKKVAEVSMSVQNFKKMFGENPRENKKYKIPVNLQHFIASIKTKKLQVR